MYLHTPALEVGSWYRTDSASGPSTPVTVYAHDSTDPVGSAFYGSGSTVRSGDAHGLAHFWSTAATLYCKPLTYNGALLGSGTVTSAGIVPSNPGGPPVDIASIAATVAAIPSNYANIAAAPVFPVDTQAGATDDAKFQAAVTAASAVGGVVLLGPKIYNWTGSVPAIPPNLTGPFTIRGTGRGATTVRLSSAARRFVDFTKSADYDVLGNVTIEDLTIDCNNIGGQHHVICGTYRSGSGMTTVNFAGVTIRRVNGINAPTDPTIANHRLWIYIYPNWATAASPQGYVTDITITDVTLSGGNAGVAIGANRAAGASTDYANCLVDRVHLRTVSHDTGLVPTQFWSSENFIIVGRGVGGTDILAENIRGKNSGDVGLEIDTARHATVRDAVIDDAWTAGFYHTNLSPALGEQRIIYDNCVARRTGWSTAAAASNNGRGWLAVDDSTFGSSALLLRGCSWYRNTSELAVDGEAILTTNITKVAIDRFRAIMEGISTTDTTAFTPQASPVNIAGKTGVTNFVKVNDLYVKVSGAKGGSAGNITWCALVLSANGGLTSAGGLLVMEITDVVWNFNITGGNSAAHRGLFFWQGRFKGAVRNCSLEAAPASASGSRGITIGTSTSVASEVVLDNIDLLNNTATDVWFTSVSGPTPADGGWTFRNMKYHSAYPEAPSSVSPGASPWTYQNQDGKFLRIIIQGGTVSQIAFSQDGATFFDTGVTAGMFSLSPADRLKVTYSAAPTVTKVITRT